MGFYSIGLDGRNRSRIVSRASQKVFEYASDALRDVGFRVKKVDPNQGVIRASTGFSWRSWGENIKVTVIKTKEGTLVKVKSEPKAQLWDMGKSSENITKFFAALNKRLLEAK